jgi:hypothetical protein
MCTGAAASGTRASSVTAAAAAASATATATAAASLSALAVVARCCLSAQGAVQQQCKSPRQSNVTLL